MWLENVFGTVHCSHFQDLGFVLSENNVHFASILEAKKVPNPMYHYYVPLLCTITMYHYYVPLLCTITM